MRDYLDEGILSYLPAVIEPSDAARQESDSPAAICDEEDLTLLITTKQASLLGYAMRHGGVHVQAAAEDIVSAALHGAFKRSLSGWTPDDSWEAYVTGAIHKGCMSYHRSRASEGRKITRLEAEREIPTFPEPGDISEMDIYSTEVRRAIEKCLCRLPIEHQQAFLLKALAGKKQREIAALLSVDQPKISRWIARARKALKQMPEIQEYWYD